MSQHRDSRAYPLSGPRPTSITRPRLEHVDVTMFASTSDNLRDARMACELLNAIEVREGRAPGFRLEPALSGFTGFAGEEAAGSTPNVEGAPE